MKIKKLYSKLNKLEIGYVMRNENNLRKIDRLLKLVGKSELK